MGKMPEMHAIFYSFSISHSKCAHVYCVRLSVAILMLHDVPVLQKFYYCELVHFGVLEDGVMFKVSLLLVTLIGGGGR